MMDDNTSAEASGVEVIQADRNAVQAFHAEMGRRLLSDIKNGTNLVDAKGEDSDPIYQAFAQHRQKAVVEMREALDAVSDFLLAYFGVRSQDPTYVGGWKDRGAYAAYMQARAALARSQDNEDGK